MNKLTRGFLLWALDNFQSSATGVPLNWRHALLFDHGADGIKTGAGRAGANDGFLVRDLDGNGLIDSGGELLGENTFKCNGLRAAQGFDALADLGRPGTSADI